MARWLARSGYFLQSKFDAVSVHDYYFPSEIDANGLTFRSYLEHIRDVMKKSGCGELPHLDHGNGICEPSRRRRGSYG